MDSKKNIETNIFVLAAALMIGLLIFISGCKKNSTTTADASGTTTTTGTGKTSVIDNTSITSGAAEGSTEVGENADDLIANSTFGSVVSIAFGTTISITNPLSASGVTITQSGGDVTINSTATGVDYQISGTTTSGSVKVYSEKKFKITLNGATITNNDGPAINIQSSKRSFIEVKDGTTNTLTDGATYATSTEDMKGTIFSEGQVVFLGTGTLNVKSNYKHVIVTDDYIRIVAGNINITGAVSDGIHSNDAIVITGGLVIGIAGATSGPTASVSTVRSLVMGSGAANTIVHIEAADGTEALTFLAPKAFTTLIYASSKLKASTTYTVYTGGSVSADATSFHGLYLTGTYTSGSKGTTFITTNVVTQTGGSISRG